MKDETPVETPQKSEQGPDEDNNIIEKQNIMNELTEMDMTKGRSGMNGTQKTLIQDDNTVIFDNSPALEESKNNETMSPHRMALAE